jgi:type I restriction-modification system DNA methylase subunit
LHRYCDEFAFRFNSRKATSTERFDFSLKEARGKRLTYAMLKNLVLLKMSINERKTEQLVLQHFSNDPYKKVNVELQKSDNAKINKLLRNASKKGDKQGHPEFIITFKEVPNFLIVVECKGDVSKHQSKNLDKYDSHAVDGSLLYASFLSKEFDVLAIAVSGQTKKELTVSHFLQLQGEPVATEMDWGNKLLSYQNYLTNYLESPQKYKQDYYSLITYCRALNNKLHHHKILANQRGLLLSSILIALDNKAFRSSYSHIEEPQDLAASLVDTVVVELKKTLPKQKVENLNHQFSFIRSDATLSLQKNPTNGKNILAELIEDIDKNVNGYIDSLKYFDVIGQLYVEFLSYANADSGLGIVLTPPHITQLFSDLAFVNKDTIVYDNCTGTAGFLISAMRAMVKDAKKDETKIKNIKEHQLIGVEYQSHIYALAATNMYIHKDGKSNIIHGDCFHANIIAAVKEYSPTVGMLNPPYPNDKVNGINEFEFVLNNLECLERNGVCVAIIPMERVMSSKKQTIELKKQILAKHTLEAVMSMPDDLFYNTDNGVVTAIVVFRAHVPHPANKETYFGYWKNDGFEKRKHKGRVDAYDKWDSIRERWIDSYVNRKNVPGLSVNQKVNHTNEWCAEAYMETDYSQLNEDEFVYMLRDYSSFLVRNNIIDEV